MRNVYSVLTAMCIAALFCSQIYASSVTLQPGAAEGVDTWVYSSQPDRNCGTEKECWVRQEYYGTIYSLIKFDLSMIPTNSIITNAYLELYIRHVHSNPNPIAYRITSNWDEMTATWNIQPTIDSAIGISNSGSLTTGEWSKWDITSFVSDWYDGTYTNYGLEIRDTTNGTEVIYSSSDEPDAFQHPKLTITYTEQAIPEPATMILLSLGMIGIIRKKYRS